MDIEKIIADNLVYSPYGKSNYTMIDSYKVIAEIINTQHQEELIEARIDENTFYLGYNKNVHPCVSNDAKKRIAQLQKDK